MFFGLQVKVNEDKAKPTTLDNDLKLTQAVLDPAKGDSNEPVALVVEYQKRKQTLCVLKPASVWQSSLDTLLKSGEEVKFFVRGEGTVHLTGYEIESSDKSDEEDTADTDSYGESTTDNESDDDMESETDTDVQTESNTDTDLDSSGQQLEQDYVKKTYDNIAEGFSGTRHKKWPKVASFVENLPKSSLLLDVGCGNGKYLDNNTTLNIGCDSSYNLLTICRKRGFEVVQCDMMRLPFRRKTFDAIICVAALHHIAAERRRRVCLKGMINLMRGNHSKLLIQVWSYEQELDKSNPYIKRNYENKEDLPAPSREISLNDQVKLPVHKNRTPFTNQDLLVPFNVKEGTDEKREHFRYYHVFKENELETMLNSIPRVAILDSYYDRGNWCSIVSRSAKKSKRK